MERRAAGPLRVWHLARLSLSCDQGARVPADRGGPIADLLKGGALKTLRTQRTLGYWCKTNPLRNLCGGRLHKWLARWVLRRGRDSTPWPGWPACRLILARFVPENCSSPSTDRVMMDTTMWPVLWNEAQLQRWWRRANYPGTRARLAADALQWPTLSRGSSSLRARCVNPGAGKLSAARGLSARPPRKRSWRHCLGRSCGA